MSGPPTPPPTPPPPTPPPPTPPPPTPPPPTPTPPISPAPVSPAPVSLAPQPAVSIAPQSSTPAGGVSAAPPPVSPAPVSPAPPAAASTNQVDAGDGGMSYLTDQSSSQLVCEPILNPDGANQSVDTSSSTQADDNSSAGQSAPYTSGQSVDPYTNQSIDTSSGGVSVAPPSVSSDDPYTNQSMDRSVGGVSPAPPALQSADPYSAGQSISSSDASQNVSSSPEEQLYSSDQNMSSAAGAGGVAMAGITAPPWYEFEDSVADSLRSNATDTVMEDMAESFESGIYSENSLVSIDRGVTPDQFADIAEMQETGQSYAELMGEPGAMNPITASHVPSITTDPVAAENLSNVYGVNEDVHFGDDHAGNYQNDPGDFADTNPEVDTEPGFSESAGEWSTEAAAGPEEALITSEEALEAGEVIVEGAEVVEGFEAADLLLLLLLL